MSLALHVLSHVCLIKSWELGEVSRLYGNEWEEKVLLVLIKLHSLILVCFGAYGSSGY